MVDISKFCWNNYVNMQYASLAWRRVDAPGDSIVKQQRNQRITKGSSVDSLSCRSPFFFSFFNVSHQLQETILLWFVQTKHELFPGYGICTGATLSTPWWNIAQGRPAHKQGSKQSPNIIVISRNSTRENGEGSFGGFPLNLCTFLGLNNHHAFMGGGARLSK